MRLSLRNRLVLVWGIGLVALIAIAISARNYPELAVRLLGTDLVEIFRKPLFTLGKIAISPSFLLKSFLFLIALTLASRSIERALGRRILTHTELDAEHRYTLARLLSLAFFSMGLIVGIETAGVDLRSLALLGSALGIGVGLGLQPIVSNFVAGLALLMERPVKLGDRIEVGSTNRSSSRRARFGQFSKV